MNSIARGRAGVWERLVGGLALVPVWACCLLVGTALFVAGKRAPVVTASLAPAAINAEQGLAFVAQLPVNAGFPYVIRGTAPGVIGSGYLLLLEDGFPLGPPDTTHALIRATGSGAYSHWRDDLYFSSSDGSDPRTNGRTYVIRAQTALLPFAHLAARPLLVLAALGAIAFAARRRSQRNAPAQRPITFAGRVLAIVCVAAAATLAVVAGTVKEIKLDPTSIQAAGPLGYVAPLGEHGGWPIGRSFQSGPLGSTSLLQDQETIGTLEPDARAVTRSGGGRYALVSDRLVFSTPDGSDPRTNGRAYSVRGPLDIDTSAWLLLALLGLIGAALGFSDALVRLAAWFASPETLVATGTNQRMARLTQALFLVVPCLAAIWLVTARWSDGRSAHLGLAGFMPLSDALAYFRCALTLSGEESLASAQIGLDWCARRILYVTTLGSFLGLSGWRPALVLIVQATIIGAAIGVIASVCARVFSRAAAVVLAACLLVFAHDVALGNFMTEAIGLPLGVLGIGLLLAWSADRARLAWLYCGLVLISVGMLARMGAFFVLPLIAAWACVLVWRTPAPRRLLACGGVLVALAAGAVLQFLLVRSFDIAATNTGGNFASTLYGLSTGSRDWHQAYKDFDAMFRTTPEGEVFSRIYAAAFDNIRRQPAVFLGSLQQNVLAFLNSIVGFSVLAPYNTPATLLFVAGLVRAVFARRAAETLLLAIFAGEVASAALIFIGNSDHRVLAVTVAARLVLIGLGAAWLIVLALYAIKGAPASGAAGRGGELRAPARAALACALVLLLAAVLPGTLVRSATTLPTFEGRGCPPNQREVVARLGRESMAIAVGRHESPLGAPHLGLEPGLLEADPGRRGAWWAENLPRIIAPTTLIYAIQVGRETHGAFVPLVYAGHVANDFDSPASICYETAVTSIDLAGAVFHRAHTVVPLAARP